jgi:Na+-transporting NADH:ubiquinone oxidoreductase subunit NqrB
MNLPVSSKMAWLTRDPRHYQIAVLSSLLVYGLSALDFDITVARAAALLGASLAWQALGARIAKIPFDPRSAMISGLSLCLLLRTNSFALAMAAAAVTIAGKFVFRFRGKHIFNPTNFGVVVLLLTGEAWVSPGQWGNFAFFAFLMACLGGLVVNRASRSDVTVAFIVCYMALVFGRSFYIYEPAAIPLHRLQSGALLLFTFFMISDPKTTPNSRAGRILFAALVAWGAWHIQFRMFRTNGLMWSLAMGSMLVPIIDRLLPGTRYDWARPMAGGPLRRPHRSSPVTTVSTISTIPHGGYSDEIQALGSRRVRVDVGRVDGTGAARLLRFLRR